MQYGIPEELRNLSTKHLERNVRENAQPSCKYEMTRVQNWMKYQKQSGKQVPGSNCQGQGGGICSIYQPHGHGSNDHVGVEYKASGGGRGGGEPSLLHVKTLGSVTCG